LFLFGALFLIGGLLFAGGCASTGSGDGAAADEKCPLCKTVVKKGRDTHGRDTYTKHTCPGCKGSVESLFSEGKWMHKCSVCAADSKCSYCGKH
jgi:hypothetical protein